MHKITVVAFKVIKKSRDQRGRDGANSAGISELSAQACASILIHSYVPSAL